ncbi:MAG TPA: hypothetical protein DCP38_04240 [Acidobacteria bacterium]|nr:hypothetical protein [Acidobacteriota bacterium]HAK54680.1 hypothetical protein [Acidobacteriota bacterium]|tara:strand:+ start:4296 stop:4556 length:261 start_codon:yes stop_codon:yes gene_type:complete
MNACHLRIIPNWTSAGCRIALPKPQKILALVDEVVQLIKLNDQQLEPKYNKHFIGLARNGKPDNLDVFQPRNSGSGLGWHFRGVMK